MSTSALEYVTQKEVDTRFSRFEEKQAYKEQIQEERQTSLEKLLDERFAKLEAVMERNSARQEASISDIRGDIKALNVRADGIDRRLDDLKESQNKWFTLFGILLIVVPIAVEIMSRLTGTPK